jgi:3-hydroxyacyl-[acyl-carrier-protein] dehydratase
MLARGTQRKQAATSHGVGATPARASGEGGRGAMTVALDTTGAGQAQNGVQGPFDIQRIMEFLPHRYPMLMLDRVLELALDDYALGVKNVSANEAIFQGHYPREPVFPGVLIIEALAQCAAFLTLSTMGPDAAGKLLYFTTIEGAKFRKPVVPGDQLMLHITKQRRRGSYWKHAGVAKVDGQVVAETVCTALILDR